MNSWTKMTELEGTYKLQNLWYKYTKEKDDKYVTRIWAPFTVYLNDKNDNNPMQKHLEKTNTIRFC